MAYTYAREKSWARHWPKLLAVAVVLCPKALTRLDHRAGFGRGLTISTHRGSPAYAALEDLRADFGPVADPARSDLPALELTRAVHPTKDLGLRQLAMRGTTIRQPAAIAPSAVALAAVAVEPDVRTSGVAALAHHLVRQELIKARPERSLATAGGTRITVAGQTEHAPRAETAAAIAFRPKFTSVASGGTAPVRALWLDGQIEMTGGLAFTGDDVEVIVKRTLDGQTLERGRIWVTEGRFEIRVGRPTGQLVAELRTRGGRVFGRGEINLMSLAEAAPRELNRIGDLRIALRPTTEVASARAISAYSHGENKMALDRALVQTRVASQALSVDAEGAASDPGLGRESTYLARVAAPGHQPSLAVARADQVRDIRLLSNTMARALADLTHDPAARAPTGHAGVVWGRVATAGSPLAGASVELTAGLEPVYFNDLYLPDRTLRRTGANGLFAFLDVPAGVQAARVRGGGGRDYPAQIFAAEDGHVSVLDFELSDDAVAQFKVIDVLRERAPRAAEVRVVGTDAAARLSGDDAVAFASNGGTMLVEADAGPGFEVSRASVVGDAGEVQLPVVRHAWVDELHDFAREARNPARGSVIGFVADQDFEVEMTGALVNERVPIVYFDAAGRPRGAGGGVAGGGFAVLNAPSGLQTVTVRPVHSSRAYARLVVAEPNLVNVMLWAPER